MKQRHLLLALAIGACVVSLSACKKDDAADTAAAPTAPKGESADEFVARVNKEIRAMYPELTAAQWLSSTYIGDDSQLLAAKSPLQSHPTCSAPARTLAFRFLRQLRFVKD